MAKGKELEEHVHIVYSMLLNDCDGGVVISKNVTLFSDTGTPHEIDVFYEFSRAGITHRVAIECKDTKRPVDKGRVHEFESKVRALPNTIGVIVSAGGYQAGAKKFAKDTNLLLLLLKDLPSIQSLIGQQIADVTLPDEICSGEPFWTIMAVESDGVTHSYFSIPNLEKGGKLIPLFFCKRHAEQTMKEAGLDLNKYAVRGLRRPALRFFINCLSHLEKQGHGALIVFQLPHASKKDQVVWAQISSSRLASDYCGENLPFGTNH